MRSWGERNPPSTREIRKVWPQVVGYLLALLLIVVISKNALSLLAYYFLLCGHLMRSHVDLGRGEHLVPPGPFLTLGPRVAGL